MVRAIWAREAGVGVPAHPAGSRARARRADADGKATGRARVAAFSTLSCPLRPKSLHKCVCQNETLGA